MVKQEMAPEAAVGQPPAPSGGGDEFDDFTMEELRELLDNFKNLSKAEQMDLIQYMRKLETTDPEKVKLLKTKTTPGGASASSGDAANTSRYGFTT